MRLDDQAQEPEHGQRTQGFEHRRGAHHRDEQRPPEPKPAVNPSQNRR
jgi:hypothetical protein